MWGGVGGAASWGPQLTPPPPHSGLRKAIDEGYHARDRAQEEMGELAKQFEMDKLERQREWALYSAAIEEANDQGQAVETGECTGLLTAEEEDALKKKIRKGHMKVRCGGAGCDSLRRRLALPPPSHAQMAKDRGVLQAAQQKLAAFNEALAYVRTSTGYEQLREIVELFNKYEEEKFEKLGTVNRMVRQGLRVGGGCVAG